MPQSAIPIALLFFNVGVEPGQLAFIAALMALGRMAARRPAIANRPWFAAAPPYAIGGLAAFWVIQRLAGV